MALGCMLLFGSPAALADEPVPSASVTAAGRIFLVGAATSPTAVVVSDTCTLVPDDGAPMDCSLVAIGSATGGQRQSDVIIRSEDRFLSFRQTVNAATGTGTGSGFQIDRETGARTPVTVAIQVRGGGPTSNPSVFRFITDVFVFEGNSGA